MNTIKNQTNPPKKGRRVDATWKIYFKHDGCSMLLFKGLTQWGASNRAHALKEMYSGWCGNFIVTK